MPSWFRGSYRDGILMKGEMPELSLVGRWWGLGIVDIIIEGQTIGFQSSTVKSFDAF